MAPQRLIESVQLAQCQDGHPRLMSAAQQAPTLPSKRSNLSFSPRIITKNNGQQVFNWPTDFFAMLNVIASSFCLL